MSTVSTSVPGPNSLAPQPASHWVAEFLLLALLWGVSFLFQRLAIADFGPWAMTLARVGFAVLFLLPFIHWHGQWSILWQYRGTLALAGLLSSALPFLAYAWAVQYISSGLAGILNASVPLFAGVVAWVWLGDRLSASRSVGLLLGFSGIIFLSLSKTQISVTGSWSTLLPIAACLGATTCYAIAASLTKKYLLGVPPLAVAAGSQFAATVIIAPFGLLWWPAHNPSANAWLAIAVVGVLSTGLAYLLFFRLVAKIGPARTTPVTFVIPVFAVLAGALFLGEQVTLAMLLWGLVIVLGTSVATGIWALPLKRFGLH